MTDIHLTGAHKVKTVLFLVNRRTSLPVVKKPKSFVEQQ